MYTLHYTIQNDQCDYTGRLRDENIFVYFSRLATVDGSLSGFYAESMKGKYGYVAVVRQFLNHKIFKMSLI